jgi:hypothetical protein
VVIWKFCSGSEHKRLSVVGAQLHVLKLQRVDVLMC